MSNNRTAWTWRHAIAESDLSATTKHVLLTISLHMNDVGSGCYPTQGQLAKETSLSDRAVRKHIDLAIDAGWLAKSEHGFKGQKWRNHEYAPQWPDIQDVDSDKQDVVKGAEPRSSRFHEGAEPDDKKVRNHVPTSISKNSQKTPLPPNGGMSASFPSGEIFEDFENYIWGDFPQNPNSRKERAWREYQKLSATERTACMSGVAKFSIRFDNDTSDKRLVSERLKFVPHLAKWIAERGWEDERRLAS